MLLKSQQVVVPTDFSSILIMVFKNHQLFSIVLLFEDGVITITILLPKRGAPDFVPLNRHTIMVNFKDRSTHPVQTDDR